MIASMTGFGEVRHAENGVDYSLEIRCVNNRYFKANIKLPESTQFAEAKIEKLLRSRLHRGSVNVILRRRNASASAAYDINHEALSRYARELSRVTLPEGFSATIDLATLSTLPGVCQLPDITEAQQEAVTGIIVQMADDCVNQVVQMRRREGQALHDDLAANCRALGAELDKVLERAPVVPDEYRERLAARVDALMRDGKFELDAESLAREVALYADRCDINEEVSRLRGHVEHFVEVCGSDDAVGRRLDFLAQEMLRETNTIGSKSNDTTIARCVVEMKALIDRIKEQVQNAE